MLAAIAFGSNLPSTFGNRAANLHAALERVSQLGVVRAASTFFDTEPVGYTEQPRFLNAAALLETGLTAPDLMQALLQIEQSMGRQREGVPAKGPRVIDLDLLFADDQIINSPDLILPHPAMHERRFVLEPLCQIAPDWVHPVRGLSVKEMFVSLILPQMNICSCCFGNKSELPGRHSGQ